MRIAFKKILLIDIALILLAIVSIVLYSFAGSSSTAEEFFSVTAMILIVLSGFVFALFPIFAIIETLTSKNDNTFKILWSLILFFTGWLGFLAYLFLGRKELK